MRHLHIQPNIKEVIFELIEDEMIILNLRDGNYYTLDSLGRIIWDLILRTGHTERIIDEVHKVFQGRVDRETLQEVIHAFIDALSNAGLVVHLESDREDHWHSDIHFEPPNILLEPEAFSKPILHSYQALQEKFKHPAGIKRSDE